MENWKQLDTHPAAHIVPLMSETEFGNLKDSIKKFGFWGESHPITLFEGRILDGRNRWEACVQLDVEPDFSEYTGDDPYWFAWYSNVEARRALTLAQKAAAAARLTEALIEDREAAAKAAGYGSLAAQRSAERAGKAPSTPNRGEAPKIISAKTGVSRGAIDRALEVKRKAPDVFEKMEKAQITVNAAEAVVKERESAAAIIKEIAVRDATERADDIEYVKYGTVEDQNLRQLFIELRKVFKRLKTYDVTRVANNCHIDDSDLDGIIEFLCDVRTVKDTGSVIIVEVNK